MSERVHAADKDVRAEARILTDRLGFTFEGYTASGHLRFTRPGFGDEIRLSATPSTFGWIRTHRQRVARALGISRRELEHKIAGDRRPGTGHVRAPKARPILGVCPTGKTGFESRAKARKAISRMHAAVAPRRTYLCDGCGLWHLTKQEQRPPKKDQVVAVPTPISPARPPDAPGPVVLRTPAEVRRRINTLLNEARAVSRRRSGPAERPPQLDELRHQIDDLQSQLRRMTLEEAA